MLVTVSLEDTVDVICPYCYERMEIYVDPQTVGEVIRDCDVCCRPWSLHIARGEEGDLHVAADRAQ